MKNYIKIFLLSVFAVAACSEVQMPEVDVNSLQITAKEITLSRGRSFALSVIMSPEDATDRTIVWKSTKESVATVSPDGLVTAVGYGTSYIVATNPASSLMAACMVTVPMKGPYQIVVMNEEGDEISNTLYGCPGMSICLEAISTDDELGTHTYNWTSSADDYISVQNGVVFMNNTFPQESPTGYLLYAESEIEVCSENGTTAKFRAVNNVLAEYVLNGVRKLAGIESQLAPSESRTVQIVGKTESDISVLPYDQYSLSTTDNSIAETVLTSKGWIVRAVASSGTAEIILTIAEREFKLAVISIREGGDFAGDLNNGETEKFPMDDDIDWEIQIEEENQENQ